MSIATNNCRNKRIEEFKLPIALILLLRCDGNAKVKAARKKFC